MGEEHALSQKIDHTKLHSCTIQRKIIHIKSYFASIIISLFFAAKTFHSAIF